MNQQPQMYTPVGAAPAATAEATKTAHQFPVIQTPVWMTAIRGFQFLLGIIILGLSGYIIHYVYMDELGLSVSVSLFTWIIVVYAVLTEKIPSARAAYNIFAVLTLDAFLIIMWLATMGAVAARRGTFIYNTRATCTSDGSLVNSGSCTLSKRRTIFMSYSALDMLSAVAGLSALQFILFIACFVYILMAYLKLRKQTAPTAGLEEASAGVPEPKPQPQAYVVPTQPAQAYPQAQPGSYPPQYPQYPQQVPTPAPVQGYMGMPPSAAAVSPISTPQQQQAYPQMVAQHHTGGAPVPMHTASPPPAAQPTPPPMNAPAYPTHAAEMPNMSATSYPSHAAELPQMSATSYPSSAAEMPAYAQGSHP